MIVPLVPTKAKISFFPVSADMVVGGVAIIIGLLYLIFAWKEKKLDLEVMKVGNIKLLTVFILIFWFFSAVSYIYADNKVAVISETMRFMEYLFIFYLIILISDRVFLKRILFLFLSVMIFAATFGLIQFALDLSTYKDVVILFNRGRVYSTFVNPNYWGTAVNMVIFYPILNFFTGEKRYKKINMVIFMLFFFNLIFSGTRGSFIGFLIGVIIIGAIKYRKALWSIPIFTGVAYILPYTRKIFLSIFNFSPIVNMKRIRLWKAGLLMFRDNILFGVGNGNYINKYFEYKKRYPKLDAGGTYATAHNSYIKVLAELGLVGIIPFIGIYLMLFIIVVNVYKATENRRLKLISLCTIGFYATYFFQNLLNNLIFIPQINVFVWIITAVLFKLYYLERKELENGVN